MADIFAVCGIVERMADGFEQTVMECLAENAAVAEAAVREQMYSGLDGDGQFLTPTYDNDPYFEEEGPWFHNGAGYKAWKRRITPPERGVMLLLPPRPDSVPNLFINGKFHSEVFAAVDGDTLAIKVKASGHGPDIAAKYGDSLLRLGTTAVGYINDRYLIPRVWRFFAACGYKP